MKKMYIVTALVLCAVFSVEAEKPLPVKAPFPWKEWNEWTAKKLGQEPDAEKIKEKIDASIIQLKPKLAGYRSQLNLYQKLGRKDLVKITRSRIKTAETKLDELQKLKNCAK